MFFQTNIVEPTRIDAILSSEEPRLTDILDEDDVIQQCVGQNTKLLDFLCRDGVFNELLGYILTDPDPQLDVTLQYKYPSRACEVLTCDIPELTTKLASSEDYVSRIFSSIDLRTRAVTSLQASFCVKLIQHLYKMKTKMLFDFMEKRPKDIVEIIASSLHLPCLVDLLLQFASPIEDVDSVIPASNGFLSPLVEAGLPGVLLKALSPTEINDKTRDAATNAGQFSCEIIRSGPSPLASAILCESSITSLFSLIFPVDSSTSVPEFALYHGFGVINTVLSQDHQSYDRLDSKPSVAIDDFDNIDAVNPADDATNVIVTAQHAPLCSTANSSNQAKPLPDYVHQIVTCLLNHMAQIRALIENAPPQYASARLRLSSTINGQNNGEIAPLGRLRLRVIETIQLLVEQRDAKIDTAVAENCLLPAIFQVFVRYRWNSLLHNSVERISSTILLSGGTERGLLEQLVTSCEFVRLLLDNFKEKEKLGNLCPGYSGQILQMANHFARVVETNGAEVAKYVSAENMEEWRNFANDTLVKINDRNKPDRLSTVSSALTNTSANSTIMMMMAGGIVSSALTLNGQRLRIGMGRSARAGVSGDDDDDDDDDDIEDSDHRDNEQFSIDNVLMQMQSEYQKQDLSAKPLSSFNNLHAGLDLDPQKSVLANLPPLPRIPMTVLPPDQRNKQDSSDSDDDINDNEAAFEAASEQRIKIAKAPIAKPQSVSDDSDDDNLWRDDEVQQGSFEAAKHSSGRHVLLREDAQGNVREIPETDWNPFTSSTPDQPSTSPVNKEDIDKIEDSSSNSSRASSDDDDDAPDPWAKESSHSAFADFSVVPGGTDWPGSSTVNDSDDWPGAGEPKHFEAQFTDLFPTDPKTEDDSSSAEGTTVSKDEPSKTPPAIPPRTTVNKT